MKCNYCNIEIPDESLFCPVCGRKNMTTIQLGTADEADLSVLIQRRKEVNELVSQKKDRRKLIITVCLIAVPIIILLIWLILRKIGTV